MSYEDLAEVDARLLAGQEHFEGPTPPLTGCEALDLDDLARLAGELTGRTIKRTIVTEERLRENLMAASLPVAVQDIVTGYYRGARAGEFLPVDPTLERIIGTRPTGMTEVLRHRLTGDRD